MLVFTISSRRVQAVLRENDTRLFHVVLLITPISSQQGGTVGKDCSYVTRRLKVMSSIDTSVVVDKKRDANE